MAEHSNIAWTNATWNPVRGCERVSEGCRKCYAEVLAARHSYEGGWGSEVAKYITRKDGTKEARWTGVIETKEVMLPVPLKWRTPRRVFVNSMSDLFHDRVPFDFIDKIFAVMALTPRHTYQILTKRPARMLAYMTNRAKSAYYWEIAARALGYTMKFTKGREHGLYPFPLQNVWMGISAEDQTTFDERVEQLGQVPTAVRFVSLEPLLGEIDVGNALDDAAPNGSYGPIHWGIVGAESGHERRPMDMEHARSLIRQFKLWKKPIFVKQDSGPRPGMQGRFTDKEWALKEYPV